MKEINCKTTFSIHLHMAKHQSRNSSYERHRNKNRNYAKGSSSTYRCRRIQKRKRYSPSSPSSPSYSSPSSSSSHSSSSSSTKRRHQVGHFQFRRGEKLNHRYKVKKLLGDGTFGRVLECKYHHRKYAIKVIKPVQKYIDSARTQRKIIHQVNRKDPYDQWGIVRYKESFYHKDHFCMVFRPLGKSLYQFIKMNNYRGFPIKLIQSFFRQILRSLGFLHSINYTHTDLKPENILLQSTHYSQVPSEYQNGKKYYLPNRDKIRIIDFGGATLATEYHSSIINTRQYRSPEVILQCCRWTQISDVWSIGCIISELFTGELLFPTHDDIEHLAMIEKNCGRYPNWMIENAGKGTGMRRVFEDGLINQDKVERIENVIGLKILEQLMPGHPELVNLLRRCLEIDPNRRITCNEALHHPFFQLTL